MSAANFKVIIKHEEKEAPIFKGLKDTTQNSVRIASPWITSRDLLSMSQVYYHCMVKLKHKVITLSNFNMHNYYQIVQKSYSHKCKPCPLL